MVTTCPDAIPSNLSGRVIAAQITVYIIYIILCEKYRVTNKLKISTQLPKSKKVE